MSKRQARIGGKLGLHVSLYGIMKKMYKTYSVLGAIFAVSLRLKEKTRDLQSMAES